MPTTNASIWALAFPIILSNITVPLLGAVDAAVMGHMDSAAYLGAVAIGGLIFDYIYWGFGFLRQGTTGLAAQALGRQDGDEVRAIFARAALIALVGALILWLVHPLIFLGASSLIDASPEVEALSETYFNIRIWSAPAALMNYALIGWILAQKDTKSVLIQQIIINGVNVILDLWFVIGLGFDIKGVAIASVLAQYCGLFVGLYFFKKNLNKVSGHWVKSRIFLSSEIKRLLSINSDIFVRTVCLLSAFAWFTSQGAKMGDVVLAANAILMQFLQFTSYALDGFAHAVEILCAHATGKKDRSEFKEAVKASTKLAIACASLFSLVYFIAGPSIIGLFTDIQDVSQMAESYLIWMIIMPLVAIGGYQLDGIYFGMTQTRPLRNMMILTLGFYLLLSQWTIVQFGNHGLWFAFTFFMLLRAITLYIRFPNAQKKAFS